MRISRLMRAVRCLFRYWFHKRNIIIVSEHKVNHLPIGGGLQFCALMLAAGAICWASYSTGSFMAARHALKEQTQTLRSVTNARVDTRLNPLLLRAGTPHLLQALGGFTMLLPPEPLVTPSALERTRMSAQMALLESKITELQIANETIIERVHDKTSGRIGDLKSIIGQTGLDLSRLKKASVSRAAKPLAEGGPYIPSQTIELPASADAMFASLDELAELRRIIEALPLGAPIKGADEQSGFGRRVDPFTGHLAFHGGIDLSGAPGAKIRSTADGVVTFTGRNGAYGTMVDIDHGAGLSTRYGHLSEILVRTGQQIKKDGVIGIQGNTGRSTGPHLHYEVRYYDRPMNPKNFLTAGTYVPQD